MSWSTGPTLADFTAYLENVVQVPTSALPPTSPYIADAYNSAIEVVNLDIQGASPIHYTLAVYSLGTSILINFCPDQTGQTYFADLRKTWNLTSFIGGAVASASDQGTSDTLAVPDYFKLFTIADLARLKDPYGRQYMAVAMQYGSLWGLS